MTGKDSCQVRVRLTSFIQLSARIDISVSDFYNNNGATTFITNICAFLGIDTGRLKIVGVSSGSTIVNAQLVVEDPSIEDAQESNDPAKEKEELDKLASKLKAATSNNEIDFGAPLIQLEAETVSFNDDGTKYTEKTDDNDEDD